MSVSDNTSTPRRGRPPLSLSLPPDEPKGEPNRVSTADHEADGEAPQPKRRVTRETRKPFGSLDQKLAYPARPGYHRHWFTDKPGRITAAREAGYEHVMDETGKMVSRVVGKDKKGDAEIGYLMEIPQEWYDEDMKRVQDRVNQTDQAIRRGVDNSTEDDGRYVPSQGITVRDTFKQAPRESR